jgi:hypothetical protein
MARRHKPRLNPLSRDLVKVFGKMAIESTSAEDFIYMAQKTIVKKDVATHFKNLFGTDRKGKEVSRVKASNLFRVYCKLIYRYGSTKPEL